MYFPYQSIMQGFARSLEKFKERSTANIYSTGHIELTIDVNSEFEDEILAWEGNNQRVLFVSLSAPELNYFQV